MAAMAVLSLPHSRVLFIIEGTAAAVSVLAVAVSDYLYRRNITTTVRSVKRVLSAEEERAFQEFALPVAVVAPAGTLCGQTPPLCSPSAGAGPTRGRMF